MAFNPNDPQSFSSDLSDDQIRQTMTQPGSTADLESRVTGPNTAVVQAARQGAGTDQPATPEVGKGRQIMAAILNLASQIARVKSIQQADPRVQQWRGEQAIQGRELDVRQQEAQARLEELKAWHQGSLGARNYSTDVRSQYNQGRLNQGEENIDVRRQQMSQNITAKLSAQGLKPTWDENGNFQGITKMTPDELSAQQTANLGLTQAKTGLTESHARYLDQLPHLRQQLQQMADDSKVEVANIMQYNGAVRNALLSQDQSEKPEQMIFLKSMDVLKGEESDAARNAYLSYGKSSEDVATRKANFDKQFETERQNAITRLTSSVGHGGTTGPAPHIGGTPPSYKHSRSYLGHTYGRNSDAETWTLVK